ncbi:hypothetical protein D3C85_1573240 [compost metagenome]
MLRQISGITQSFLSGEPPVPHEDILQKINGVTLHLQMGITPEAQLLIAAQIFIPDIDAPDKAD